MAILTPQERTIESLYVAYFNRPADVSGLNYWADALTTNPNPSAVLTQISQQFSTSAEYQADYAGLTSAQLVNKVYVNLFGHNADLPGLNYWTLLVDKGIVTMAYVVTEVAKGAQGSDKVTYDSKVTAAGQFTKALNPTGSALAYTGAGPNVIAANWLAGVTGPSLAAHLAQIPSVIDAILTPAAVTESLTINQDIIDTSANLGLSTVYGIYGNAADNSGIANTYTPGDSITGNAKTSLQLSDHNLHNTVNLTAIPQITVQGVGALAIYSNETVIVDTSGLVSTHPTFTGLNTLEVNTVSGYLKHGYNNVDTITAAVTTAVTVKDSVEQDWKPLGPNNGLAVNGGSTVDITEHNDVHAGCATITVTGFAGPNGSDGTTAVSVFQDGLYSNNGTLGKAQKSQDVLIQDYASWYRGPVTAQNALNEAASISTVALAGLFWAHADVASDALQYLTINDSSGSGVSLWNYGYNTNSATELNLTLNHDLSVRDNLEVRNLSITDENSVYVVLNVTTGPLASVIDLDNFNALTTLTVTGQSVLTVDPTLTALQTITVYDGLGSTGFIDLNLYNSTVLEKIDATAATGVVAVLGLNAHGPLFPGDVPGTTFLGGSGPTLVGITTDATLTVDAGVATGSAGVADKIAVLEADSSYFTLANTKANVTGFNTLGTDGFSSGNFVVNGANAILSGIEHVNVISDAARDVTFSGANPGSSAVGGTDLQFSGQESAQWIGEGKSSTHYTFLTSDTSGIDYAVDVKLGVDQSQSLLWAGALAPTTHVHIDTLALGNAQGLAADGPDKGTPIQGISLVNFNSVGDTGTWGWNTIDTLLDQQLKVLTLTGNYGLKIDHDSHYYLSDQTSLTLIDNGTSAKTAKPESLTGQDPWNTGLVFKDGIYANELNYLHFQGTDVSTLAGANSISIGTLAIGCNGNESSTLTILDDAKGDVQIGKISDQQDDLKTLTLTNTDAKATLHLGGLEHGDHHGGVTWGADNLNLINLNGKVAVGSVDVDKVLGYVFNYQSDPGNVGLFFSNDHSGVTVKGGTDNANVAIGTGGATAGFTDKITLGSGNNFIVDHSGDALNAIGGAPNSAGNVAIIVGTGDNEIVLGHDKLLGHDDVFVANAWQSGSAPSVIAGGYSHYEVTLDIVNGNHVNGHGNDIIDVSSVFGNDLIFNTPLEASVIINNARSGTLIGDTAGDLIKNHSVDHEASDGVGGVDLTNADINTAFNKLYSDLSGVASAGHVEWAVANSTAATGPVTLIVENLDGNNFALVQLTGAHSISETSVNHTNYLLVA